MPLDLAARRANRTITVPVKGDEITLSYRPQHLTTNYFRELAKQQFAEVGELPKDAPAEEQAEWSIKNLRQMRQMVAFQVESWDITDGGQPLPLTIEALEAADIDVEICSAILTAIREDGSPNPPTSTN